MAKFRIVIHTSNKRKDGSYPVCLRITKNGKLKYIYLNLSAFENEWDKNAGRFKRDKRMNPNYESYNNWLISCWKIQCKLPPKTKRFCPLVLK